MNDIVWMSAAELSAAFAKGTLSPVEAARAILARIEAADPAMNAFCHLDPETDAPPIAGQYPNYLRTQLMLFRAGIRLDNVMNAIAADLTDEEIAAVAAFFGAFDR